jgi:negative regulator of flagellin synthesis FlgM
MNTTIKTGITPQHQPQPKTGSVAASNTAAESAAGSSVRGTDDSVSLTSSAQALGAASKVGDSMDTQKIDSIRQSIASGTYQVNSSAIATNLIAMETQMGGTA